MSNLSNYNQNPTTASSALRTIASENAIVTADELANDKDLPLEEILHERKENQTEQASN